MVFIVGCVVCAVVRFYGQAVIADIAGMADMEVYDVVMSLVYRDLGEGDVSQCGRCRFVVQSVTLCCGMCHPFPDVSSLSCFS